MNTHKQIKELLAWFALDDLSEQQKTCVQNHLDQCGQCREELQQIQKLLEVAEEMKNKTADEQLYHSAAASVLNLTVKQSKGTSQQIHKHNFWRFIMKSPITKIAAAVVIIISILIAVHYFNGPVNITSPVFADVIEQIYQARSVTYLQTFHPGKSREFTTEKMIIESGIMRSELPYGDITIFDFSGGKNLHLMLHSKTAILTHRVGRPRGNKLLNYLDWLSTIHEEEGIFTGQQELDGKITNVFVTEKPFEKTTVWVNPETNLPVRVKMEQWPNPDKDIIVPKMSLHLADFGGSANLSNSILMFGGKGIQEEMTIVLSDFVWDAELDETLFSLEPPEGYTLEEKQFDVSDAGENNLIEALGFWTEMSEGMFPSKINDLGDPNEVRLLLIAKFDRDGDPKEEFDQAMQQMNKILKGLVFAQERIVDDNWYYDGQGVKLGDAYTPICWWKSEDSSDYRVIYGDLSIGNLPEEDLPELP